MMVGAKAETAEICHGQGNPLIIGFEDSDNV